MLRRRQFQSEDDSNGNDDKIRAGFQNGLYVYGDDIKEQAVPSIGHRPSQFGTRTGVRGTARSRKPEDAACCVPRTQSRC